MIFREITLPKRWLRLLSLTSMLLMIACLEVPPCKLSAQDMALFSETASATLERQFQDPSLSWLLVDRSGNAVAQHWSDARQPIPPGSLVKPFLALAYGEQHGFLYPQAQCLGTNGKCWLPAGHGRLGLGRAIAQSCNDYFLSLARDVDRDRAMETFRRLGLGGPPHGANDQMLIGLDEGWRETPLSLARAYLKLIQEAPQGAQRPIVAGMGASAQSGTARGVDVALGTRAALAKTGTTVCTHHPRGAADGFAVVLYPAQQPRLLLLVRRHGSTGAQTAVVAGSMLHSLGMGEIR